MGRLPELPLLCCSLRRLLGLCELVDLVLNLHPVSHAQEGGPAFLVAVAWLQWETGKGRE